MFLSSGMQVSQLLMELMAVFGGLGLFLYGINQMGDSLKAIAGDRLKVFVEKTTNTPLKGILVGTLVTALIQSSSGTTALTVGLVRSGLMTFPQAVGVIIGANIGTTVTSFIIGLKIEKFALLFVGIGAVLIFFIKSEKVKEIGRIIFGFGLLFFGLKVMGDSLELILSAYNDETSKVFKFLADYPILGLLIGIVVTAIVQSSSATVGIVQTLYAQASISLIGALPILMGCNIGTTFTALIASIGGDSDSKRTALVHMLFNVFGTLIFMILLWPYAELVSLIERTVFAGLGANTPMSIAVAHMIFNVGTTIVIFFFINLLVKLLNTIIKDKPNENQTILEELLDYSLIEKSPTLALSFAKKSIDYMGKCVVEYVDLAKEYSFENKKDSLTKGEELEKNINCLDKRIHDYLIKLTINDLTASNSHLLSVYLDTIKDLERIGDHCSNILEFFEERYSTNKTLSEDSLQDLNQIYEVLLKMLNTTISAFNDGDKDKAGLIDSYEEEIDKLVKVFHERHLHRINSGDCSIINADYYMEILSNIERIGDHLKNISDDLTNDEYCKYDEYDH